MSALLVEDANPARLKGSNGVVSYPLGFNGAYYTITVNGGRYDDFPGGEVFGVCVRAEGTKKRVDVKVPIRDFQVPTPEMEGQFITALKEAAKASLNGRHVWVGCMGGIGRTGLFLSVLAKAAGQTQPVEYVREHYYEHAVETPEQYDWVMNFDVREFQGWLLSYTWRKKFWDTVEGFFPFLSRSKRV